MGEVKKFDEFINEDYNAMNKKIYTFDERTGKYFVFGKEMPKEFIDAYDVDESNSFNFFKFKYNIENRNINKKTGRILKEPFRFSQRFSSFLTYVYKGNLPHDIVSLAKYFNFPNYLVDLFVLNEESYKQKYREEYDNFFNNRTLSEKEKVFHSADFGWRNIFELEQDTIASNIFENMICYHGLKALEINDKSTGRAAAESTITKKCDLIYNIKTRSIKFPVEVKTKWKRNLDVIEYVSMRDNAETLKNDRGMILAVYLGLEHEGVKAIVIDSVGNTTIKGQMSVVNKDSENYVFNSKELMNFEFWVEKDMRDMLNNIYLIYKKREENK